MPTRNRSIKASKTTKAQLEKEVASLRKRLASLRRKGTERTRAEEALRKSYDFSLSLFDKFPAPIWRSGVDAKCDYFNAAWLDFTGRKLDRELGDGWAEGVHSDDLESCLKTYREAFHGRKPFAMEYRLRRYDGEYRSVIDIGRPYHDLDGNFAGYLGSCYDITERRRAEEGLREANEKLQTIFQAAPLGLFVLDPAGRIQVWNVGAERIYGWCEQEVLGCVCPTVPEEELNDFLGTIEQVMRGKSFTGLVCNRLRRDGTRIVASISLAPLHDSAGSVQGIVAILQDITERRRLEEQLRQSQKIEAIGRLASGIAHDFNNILTAILGFTDLAMDAMPEPHPARADLSQVTKAGNRAKALVQQILAFSRQDKGDPTPVSLVSLITDTLPLLRATIPTTIEIRPCLEPGGSLVLADATQMQQVLINLCSNAEYAMRETGGILNLLLDTIAVDAAFAASHPPLQPGPHVRLTVRDTGRGMAPEILERVFDPFFTTKTLGEGTGLGLSTAHGIVTGHGGMITVVSTVGGGATFEVYLPQLLASAIGQAPTDRKLPGGTEEILFVDDEEALVRLAEQMLTRLGYHVVGKSNSLEALAEFRTAPDRFDLVITDQTMPKMTGEALAIELLRLRPTLPIILYTGFSHTMTPDKAAALGIRAFLMKPFVLQDLADTIRRVLGQPAGNA